MKRFGRPAYPDQRVLFKLSEEECRRVPLEVLNEMEESGKYSLGPKCYERLDEYRAQVGS